KFFTNGFLAPKDAKDAKLLTTHVKLLREKAYPTGADDLKGALKDAIDSFPKKEGRQRILVYLGNGQSLENAISAADRRQLVAAMVEKRVAFFSVPLGRNPDPTTLHGFATGTGGVVMRTLVEEEKLTDALDRYEAAFAGTILYAPQLHLPAEVVTAEVLPTVLPPLRSDAPTLLVGKMKPAASF